LIDGSLINVSFKEKFEENVEVGKNSFCEFSSMISPTTTSNRNFFLGRKHLLKRKIFDKTFIKSFEVK